MSVSENQLEANYRKFRQSLQRELQNLGRQRESITVIAVSKTMPVAVVNAAMQVGIHEFGENRLQEALLKIPAAKARNEMRWHMIGHLQSNKVKDAVGLFHLIQSVDSYVLAQLINRRSETLGRRQDILIQVNTSGEEQKSGCRPDEAEELVDKMSELPCVRIMGLMTIGPLTGDEMKIARAFANLRRLYDLLTAHNLHGGRMRYCSMGMSDDWRIALAEGANMLRIGRAIFGARAKPAPATS